MINTEQLAVKLHESSVQENGTKELLHQVFLADKNHIVRKPKEPYQSNELAWFISQSRDIKDLELFAGFTPKIWKDIAEVDGTVNSNYGWCCLSKENGNQFENAMKHLKMDKNSRRAIMIYNRPSMHTDWIKNRATTRYGNITNTNLVDWSKDEDTYKNLRGDFMCCQNNHFIIRDNKLHMTVHMRSLDAVYGYNADYIWFDFIFDKAVQYLKRTYPDLTRGDMVIYADSVHVYERHFEDLKSAYESFNVDFNSVNYLVSKSPRTRICESTANPYLTDSENNAAVNDYTNPDHYHQTKIEHWDWALKHNLGYLLGCASKYVFRNRHKGQQKQDLNKVVTYCEKYVSSDEFKTPHEELFVPIIGLDLTENTLVRLILNLHNTTDEQDARDIISQIKVLCS